MKQMKIFSGFYINCWKIINSDSNFNIPYIIKELITSDYVLKATLV